MNWRKKGTYPQARILYVKTVGTYSRIAGGSLWFLFLAAVSRVGNKFRGLDSASLIRMFYGTLDGSGMPHQMMMVIKAMDQL